MRRAIKRNRIKPINLFKFEFKKMQKEQLNFEEFALIMRKIDNHLTDIELDTLFFKFKGFEK